MQAVIETRSSSCRALSAKLQSNYDCYVAQHQSAPYKAGYTKPTVVTLQAATRSAQTVAAVEPPLASVHRRPDTQMTSSVASNPADTTLSVGLAHTKLSAWKTSTAEVAAEVEWAADL